MNDAPSTSQPLSIQVVNESSSATVPVTTAAVLPNPNINGSSNSNVTVTLKSQEPGGSGVKQITYSAAGAQKIASTVVVGSSATFTISSEGITTITFFAMDNSILYG